jgi:hypothetical protein
MFAKLLQPHLLAVGHQCLIETVRNNKQKEMRIIDTLEPLMGQHRLVVCESVVRMDDELVQGYGQEHSLQYRLFHQMTRITRDRGALAHDDRLDAVAGSVAYWVDAMAQDAAKAAMKAKDKAEAHIMKEHLENQLGVFEKPSVARKRRKQDGFVLTT